MPRAWIITCICICGILQLPASSATGYYVISAPGGIYSGRPFGVVVTMFNSRLSCSCEVRISGPSYNHSIQINLTPPDPVRSIQFKVPQLQRGVYQLSVKSVRGFYFTNTTNLYWHNFRNFVHIQLPKTHYKPAELLQFRVLFFNEVLNYVKPEAGAHVWLEDAQNNVIKNWTEVNTKSGVFETQLQLVHKLVLGRWRLCAQNGADVLEECAYFKVKEYVPLPFHMIVLAATKVALSQGVMHVTVKARYSFGGIVEGNVTLYMETYTDEDIDYKVQYAQQNATLQAGKAQLVVSLSQFAQAMPKDVLQQLSLSAVVEERFTAVRQSSNLTITLYEEPYQVSCINLSKFCRTLVANRERTVGFRVKHLNGSRVLDENAPVILTYVSTDNNTEASKYVFSSALNKNGKAYFTIKLNLTLKLYNYENELHFRTYFEYKNRTLELLNTVIQIRAPITAKEDAIEADINNQSFEDDSSTTSDESSEANVKILEMQIRESLSKPSKPKKPHNMDSNFFQFDNAPQLGTPETLTFEAQSKKGHALCLIYVNGNIMGGKAVYPDAKKMIYEIKLQFNRAMWPVVNVFLYAIAPEADVLLISQKTIGVKYSHEQLGVLVPDVVTAGESLSLQIKAIPGSYVGLLAVEHSTLQLDPSRPTDLNKSLMEMLKYSFCVAVCDENKNRDMPGITDGLLTMTNAVHFGRAAPLEKSNTQRTKKGTNKVSIKDLPVLRHPLSDVWIFDSISITKNSTSWITQVPDSLNSWQISAFAMHPVYGLMLMEHPINVRSSKTLFMSTKLPDSIRKDEILRIPLVCFNKLNGTVEVTITLNPDSKIFTIYDEKRLPLHSAPVSQKLQIAADDSNVAYFYVRAHSYGLVQLNFTANTDKAKDTLQRALKVAQEDLRISPQVAIFRALHRSEITKGELILELPQQRPATSIECLVSGQVLGPKLREITNFERLNNAEQLITKLLNSYYLWDFLRNQTKPESDWLKHVEQQLNEGYQSLLSRRRPDGGICYYEAQQTNDNCSSTWLTAYALRVLQLLQVTKLEIDKRVLRVSSSFLLSRLRNNSYFEELPKTPTRNSLEPLELTFEVLQALLPMMPKELSANWDAVLQQIQHLQYRRLLLKSGLQFLHNNQSKMWPATETNLNDTSQSKQNLENAGYELLVLLNNSSQGRVSNLALPWLRLLISKLYGQESAGDSYESAVAQHAIFEYAKRVRDQAVNFTLELEANDIKKRLNINAKNIWKVRKVTLPASARKVLYEANGEGQLLLQCAYKMNLDQAQPSKAIDARSSPQLYRVELIKDTYYNGLELDLELCVKRSNIHLKEYKGSELEFELPSSYTFTDKSMRQLRNHEKVQLLLEPPSKRKITMYLHPLPTNKVICLPMQAQRTHEVLDPHPGIVQIYDTDDWHKPEIFNFEV